VRWECRSRSTEASSDPPWPTTTRFSGQCHPHSQWRGEKKPPVHQSSGSRLSQRIGARGVCRKRASSLRSAKKAKASQAILVLETQVQSASIRQADRSARAARQHSPVCASTKHPSAAQGAGWHWGVATISTLRRLCMSDRDARNSRAVGGRRRCFCYIYCNTRSSIVHAVGNADTPSPTKVES